MIFEKKGVEYKMCFDFPYNSCPENFSSSEEFGKILSWMYRGRHIKYPFQTFIKLEFSQHIFEKHQNIKFRENPFGAIPVVQCGRTDGRTDRQTDMKQLTVVLRNFAHVSKEKLKKKYITDLPFITLSLRILLLWFRMSVCISETSAPCL